MWHEWRRGAMHIGYLWESQKKRDHWENQDVGGLLVFGHDMNLLIDNINIMKRNSQALIDASKEERLEVNTEDTKWMLLSLHQNEGQNLDINIGNRCNENVAQLSGGAQCKLRLTPSATRHHPDAWIALTDS
jgi:hypothetical protein